MGTQRGGCCRGRGRAPPGKEPALSDGTKVLAHPATQARTLLPMTRRQWFLLAIAVALAAMGGFFTAQLLSADDSEAVALTACEAFERIQQVRSEVGVAEERFKTGWSVATGTDGYSARQQSLAELESVYIAATATTGDLLIELLRRASDDPVAVGAADLVRFLSVWFGDQAEYVGDRHPSSREQPRVGGDVRREDLSPSSSDQAAYERVDWTLLDAAHRECGL